MSWTSHAKFHCILLYCTLSECDNCNVIHLFAWMLLLRYNWSQIIQQMWITCCPLREIRTFTGHSQFTFNIAQQDILKVVIISEMLFPIRTTPTIISLSNSINYHWVVIIMLFMSAIDNTNYHTFYILFNMIQILFINFSYCYHVTFNTSVYTILHIKL